MRILTSAAFVVALSAVCAGCATVRAPQAAITRTSPPPWPAPPDAVAYITASGLPQVRLDARENPHIVKVDVVVDGAPVEIPAYLGVDRLRAVQAPVHTHDTSGQVWIEGAGNLEPTLGQFFALWGVRFTNECLGSVCGQVEVRADGNRVADPASSKLRSFGAIRVEARPVRG